jgi:Transposase DDE domain
MVEMSMMLARLKREPLANLPLTSDLDQTLSQLGHAWRDRLLSPLVTLKLFLIQVLAGNCSIAAVRQLAGIDFAPSSYSDARKRLPLDVLQWLLQWLQERAEQTLGIVKKIGPRILIADGSSYSMPDTPELRAHFDLPAGTRPGVGYPAGKLMGLLDAATGMFISLLALPLFTHDMRGVIGLHPMLREGDILLGDRAFCSFCHLAMLQARGVFACVRLHQRRKETVSGVSRWKRPTEPPEWMDLIGLALLPQFMDIRIVAYTIARKGYRTRRVLIATTLMDRTLWPDEKIAELYGQRWQIETCFDHLKTTMNMNVLRCTTLDGVTRELAMYLAAYNLVRLAMLAAAQRQQVSVDRISFADAMRWLLARILGHSGVQRLIVNPHRPGRSQLRVIRRRLKEYPLLKKSRREAEAEIAAKQGVNA